jgi:hypothetical protein
MARLVSVANMKLINGQDGDSGASIAKLSKGTLCSWMSGGSTVPTSDGEQTVCLARRQLPLVIDNDLTMIMALDDVCLACDSSRRSRRTSTSTSGDSPPALMARPRFESSSCTRQTSPSPTENKVSKDEALFLRKCQKLSNDELAAALMVPMDWLLCTLSQEVSCVGCRKAVEVMCHMSTVRFQTNEGTALSCSALEPLFIGPDRIVSISREHMLMPQGLCNLFCSQMQRLREIFTKDNQLKGSKKGGRCSNHNSLLARRPTNSSQSAWIDAWENMETDCRRQVLTIPFAQLKATIDRYLKKHSFCTECTNMVHKAYDLLFDEQTEGNSAACEKSGKVSNSKLNAKPNASSDETSTQPLPPPSACSHEKISGNDTALEKTSKKAALPWRHYHGVWACLKEQHVHVLDSFNVVSECIDIAEPELRGHKQERHAKTLDVARNEVLICIGLILFERFTRIQQKFREGQQTCELLFFVALTTLKQSFDLAVERKQGISDLERFCKELDQEEQTKKERAQKKKEKKEKQNAKRKIVQKEKENTAEIRLRDDATRAETKAILKTSNGSGSAKGSSSSSPSSTKKGDSDSTSQNECKTSENSSGGSPSPGPNEHHGDVDQRYVGQHLSILQLDELLDVAGDDEVSDDYSIPAEEIKIFQERHSVVMKQREELRKKLRSEFASLCANFSNNNSAAGDASHCFRPGRGSL